MSNLIPSLSDCRERRDWLNEGELRVAEALDECLDADWTIYVQPRLGLDMPDFVAVHDTHGVCAIEVKDWAYGKYRNSNGVVQYRCTDGWTAVSQHPRLQAHRYRSNIFEHCFALPEDPSPVPPCVRSVVVLLNHPTKQAMDLLRAVDNSPGTRGITVMGEEFFDGVESALLGPVPTPPPSASVERLRAHLRDATYEWSLTEEIKLSHGAKNIAQNPSNASMRRVRGSAGSGKSFGLAARAAVLAGQGKSVLVLSFNVTLAHFLRSLVSAHCLSHSANPTLVSCTHFHDFCKRVTDHAKSSGLELEVPPDVPRYDSPVAKAIAATEQGMRLEYDAILVDEGQDFELEWWSMLRKHLRPGGEMLLVADPTQNIFDKKAWTDEAQMLGAGFSGPWTDLGGSYRLPSDVVSIVRQFGNTYLPGEVVQAENPTGDQVTQRSGATARHWVNVRSKADLVAEMVRLTSFLVTRRGLDPSEVVFLCENHQDGLAVVEELERDHEVHHLFAPKHAGQERRRRKARFWPDAPGIKGSTTQSFKGWESRAVILGIGNRSDSIRLAYVAMTRLRADPSGRPAFLGVVNSNPRLDGFGGTFSSGDPLPPPTIEPLTA